MTGNHKAHLKLAQGVMLAAGLIAAQAGAQVNSPERADDGVDAMSAALLSEADVNTQQDSYGFPKVSMVEPTKATPAPETCGASSDLYTVDDADSLNAIQDGVRADSVDQGEI